MPLLVLCYLAFEVIFVHYNTGAQKANEHGAADETYMSDSYCESHFPRFSPCVSNRGEQFRDSTKAKRVKLLKTEKDAKWQTISGDPRYSLWRRRCSTKRPFSTYPSHATMLGAS